MTHIHITTAKTYCYGTKQHRLISVKCSAIFCVTRLMMKYLGEHIEKFQYGTNASCWRDYFNYHNWLIKPHKQCRFCELILNIEVLEVKILNAIPVISTKKKRQNYSEVQKQTRETQNHKIITPVKVKNDVHETVQFHFIVWLFYLTCIILFAFTKWCS